MAARKKKTEVPVETHKHVADKRGGRMGDAARFDCNASLGECNSLMKRQPDDGQEYGNHDETGA
jgi:hypothetical protein